MEAEKKNNIELKNECAQYLRQIEAATALMPTDGVLTIESFAFHENTFEMESNLPVPFRAVFRDSSFANSPYFPNEL